MKISIDLTQSPGFGLVLKDYQAIAMRYLWGTRNLSDSGKSSRDVWEAVNTMLEGERTSISRASIINFLNAMVDNGFLSYTEITGKGGHRRMYSAAVTIDEFWQKIAKETQEKLIEASGLPRLFKD